MVRAPDSDLEVLVHMRGVARPCELIKHNQALVFPSHHQMNTLLAPSRLALATAQTGV